ncbi:DUF4837 family protein [Aquimarina macrocephali]|uniref:DUF4837 family protein n=1 Tax=Aquimarina macrocephali TaxID=666563 RepID=UPI003F6638E0
MRKLSLAIICILCIVSCTEVKKDKNQKSQESMAHSNGRINHLSVVIDNELWNSNVGDTIRKYFGAEVPGLPQEEPLFTMRQMPKETFTGLAKQSRIFLWIEKQNEGENKYGLLKNKFSNPQIGAVISGATNEDIATLIRENHEKIISKYKSIEIKEKQAIIKKSLERIPQLQEKMGITLNIPSAYRIAIEENEFFWIRKNIKHGSMNLMIYELPLGTVTKDSNTVSSIIKMRDSMGTVKIPTPEVGHFITEEAYAPYLYEIELDNRFTFETKGIWEIKDRFMSGPFVNYVIEDIANNRLMVLEGFVFAPSVSKRDNIFELEAIIKTVKFD